jgi:hypothetical protein
MTIATLEYIHNVLKENAESVDASYKLALDLLKLYRERGADKELLDRQIATVDQYELDRAVALKVLDEFESVNWIK